MKMQPPPKDLFMKVPAELPEGPRQRAMYMAEFMLQVNRHYDTQLTPVLQELEYYKELHRSSVDRLTSIEYKLNQLLERE